jgi:hypothetical protein
VTTEEVVAGSGVVQIDHGLVSEEVVGPGVVRFDRVVWDLPQFAHEHLPRAALDGSNGVVPATKATYVHGRRDWRREMGGMRGEVMGTDRKERQ